MKEFCTKDEMVFVTTKDGSVSAYNPQLVDGLIFKDGARLSTPQEIEGWYSWADDCDNHSR
jgi:hypothetical protein